MTDEIKPTEPDTTPGLVPDPDPAPEPAPPVSPAATQPVTDEPTAEPKAESEPKADPESPAATEAIAEPRTKRRGLDAKMVGLGVATGAVAVALVLLALMVFAPGVSPVKFGSVADAQRAEQERDIDRVAARFASSLYTFNYRTIDDDLDRIRSDATGNFSSELTKVLGDVDVFKNAIVDARGESAGRVEGVDVRSVEGDTAKARVFVLQTIRNKKNPEPRQQVSMVELTLVETSGGWKVDDVQQLSAGASGAAPEADS